MLILLKIIFTIHVEWWLSQLLLILLCSFTEEQEDAEASAKSSSVSVADDKDTREKERNNSEGKKASKDSGKMLEFCHSKNLIKQSFI